MKKISIIFVLMIFLILASCNSKEFDSKEYDSIEFDSKKQDSNEYIPKESDSLNDVISEDKNMTYDEYFSRERLFDDDSGEDDNIDYYISNDEYQYLYKQDSKTGEFKLLQDAVSSLAAVSGKVYCIVENTKIIEINSITGEKTDVYEATNEISRLYANNDLIYFIMNNRIFRLHLGSGILDDITECGTYDSGDYFPYSNYKTITYALNPKIKKYAELNGGLGKIEIADILEKDFGIPKATILDFYNLQSFFYDAQFINPISMVCHTWPTGQLAYIEIIPYTGYCD